ncbi:MAG: SDR family NAD(P)-dependent oxidoreductase [Desulfobacterium sp.]|nr:SDR family NAD(P)-dependent oxidoreductase [Desulfobacterium sp.]
MADLNVKLQETPIAVVGVSALFPDAANMGEYWNNIVDEVDSIIDVPASRWNIDDYYDPDPKAPDKSYCKRGGFIPDIDFNPMEFGLPPNILEVTDVSQLLALVVARDLLKDAGYGDENAYDRGKIGITLGVGGGQKLVVPLNSRLQSPIWKRVLTSSGISDGEADILIEKIKKAYIPWEENSFPGMLGNVIAGRVANRLNLGGTNCVLDAACAGSLAGVKMAISDLLERRSEMMITGGVDTDNSPFMYLCFSKTPAFSKDDTVKTFDADSKGMLVGEGVGMILLKRLEDAERDGDHIYSVIRGMGTSSDGKFKSIYAPRPEGQAKALRQTYEIAGYGPETVGLLEAHGTGTSAGDNAEFKALRQVFGAATDNRQYIAIGSVKSQIGHTKSAAGSAGLIKAILALQHKVLPATINVKTPHPDMEIETTPFYVNTETRPWFPAEAGHPRRASVSAFGFGGTNFHVTLEEYDHGDQESLRLHRTPHMVVVTGKDTDALLATCRSLKYGLGGEARELAFYNLVTDHAMAPVETTLARIGFVVKDAEEADALLSAAMAKLEKTGDGESWNHPKGIFYRKTGMDTEGKVVALFSGQGSQYVNMGRDVAMNFPEMMDSFSDMDELFVEKGGKRLTDTVFPIPKFSAEDRKQDDAALQNTEFAQPAIGTLSSGMYKIFKNAGLTIDFSAGHSFGELTALYAAGVMEEKDFYFLARARGKAMAAPDDGDFDAGTMLAVMGDVAGLEADLKAFPGVSMANHNSGKQVVVAGPCDAIAKAAAGLKDKGYKTIPLPVSAAFHTSLVGHAQEPFARAIGEVSVKTPSIPVYSNTTSEKYPDDPEEIRKILENHILNPVRFKEEIENIHGAGGRIFVEFGPKNVLAKLADTILEDRDHMVVAVNAGAKGSADLQMRKAAVQLCVAGCALNHIDPMGKNLSRPEEKKPGIMNIPISGSNYVSEKTKKAYEDALNDGFKVSQAKTVTRTVEVPVEKVVTVVKEVPVYRDPLPTEVKSTAVSKVNPTATPVVKGKNVMAKKMAHPEPEHDDISRGIETFFRHQSEILSVHSKYIDNAGDYTRSFHDLMNSQFRMIKENPGMQIPDSIGKSMEMFHLHHGETLHVHGDYLKTSATASASVLELTRSGFVEGASVSGRAARIPGAMLPSEPATAFVQPTEYPTEHPPEYQAEHMAEQPTVQVAAPVAPVVQKTVTAVAPELAKPRQEPSNVYIPDHVLEQADAVNVSAVPAPARDVPAMDIQGAMLSIVSEKTGYPVEMLEMDMDMEADLGIDSIKRVEILAAVTETFPELPPVNPDELAGLKTLGEIAEKLKENAPTPTSASSPASVSTSASVPGTPAGVAETATPPGFDAEKLTSVMLGVVSEKTGYPEEMLELDMDMEADLGIDSIKRVEILAAVTEAFPELPQTNPDELAELKTLGQIVDKLFEAVPGASSTPASEAAPGSSRTPTSASGEETSANAHDLSSLTTLMLSVVSEKTGYPEEMLALDMDMEADLGIDSIKRVEILAAVTEAFPELPQANPDELAELKTLGQIIDNFQGGLAPAETQAKFQRGAAHAETQAKTPGNPQGDAPAVVDIKTITDSMLNVVSEKTGYPVEMLELDMDMEAELGIDSIKRVEILGAVTEMHPELPPVNPEELSELKTLGAIVNKMAAAGSPGKETAVPGGQQSSENVSENVSEDGTAVESSTAPKRSVARLVSLTQPDHLAFKMAEGEICLIQDDGTEVTARLVEKLGARGMKTVVMGFPEALVPGNGSLSKGTSRLVLADMAEETLVEAIAQVEEKFGRIGGFVHVSPGPDKENMTDVVYSEKEKALLQHVFLTAKHIKKSITESKGGRPFFVTVARMDGQLGLSGQGYGIVSGGLSGLTKTLNLEWKHVFCRAVDVAASLDSEAGALAIEKEIFDPDGRVAETAVGKAGRFTLAPVEAAPEFESKNNEITKDSVFLVSGGAKGVTAKCALKLAEDTGCKFILMGRSEFEENGEPAWAIGITGEADLKKAVMGELKSRGEKPTPKAVSAMVWPVMAAREIELSLKGLKNAGAQAVYISADVTDREAIKSQLSAATEKLGPVTGIIHGAGVLADRFIEEKTVADFTAVFATKINGLAAMLSCVDESRLKHLALFSSAAGFFGNEGQSDYAVANEILNKTAYRFRNKYPECHVNAFGWGPWDGGMVTPALKRMFESKGVDVICLDGGAKLFSQEMQMMECFPQVLVGSSMVYKADASGNESAEFTITTRLALEDNNFLYDHFIGGTPVLPTVCATSWMAEACEKLNPGFKFFRCRNYNLYKGIVFDGTQALEYQVHMQGVGDQGDGKPGFDVRVTSVKKGKTVNHYGAQIILTNDIPVAEVLSGVNLAETHVSDGATYYGNGTLFHGPNFQAIERILNINEDGMTMECRIPEIPVKDQGQFPVGTFNPYAADVQFQSILVWVREFMDAGSLPSKAKDAVHFANVPVDRKFYVTLNIVKKSDASVTADIITHDKAGRIFTQVKGAEVTVSKQLNSLFVKAAV